MNWMQKLVNRIVGESADVEELKTIREELLDTTSFQVDEIAGSPEKATQTLMELDKLVQRGKANGSMKRG